MIRPRPTTTLLAALALLTLTAAAHADGPRMLERAASALAGPAGEGAEPAPELGPDQLDALVAPPAPPRVHALARYLQLDPAQVEATLALLRERREAALPVVQAIREARRDLAALLAEPFPDEAEVGELVLDIAALSHEARQIQAAFIEGFEALLDPEQRQRLRALRIADRLETLLPAARALGVL